MRVCFAFRQNPVGVRVMQKVKTPEEDNCTWKLYGFIFYFYFSLALFMQS